MVRRLFTERKKRLGESLDSPCEGIFWVIENELIAFTEQVDTTGRFSTSLEHIKIWDQIKQKYQVSGKTVSFDYFPRGRVMVNPVYLNIYTFNHYDVFIYIDDCINNDDIITDILYEYRLNKNCDIRYIGSSGGIESNHYRCYMCR